MVQFSWGRWEIRVKGLGVMAIFEASSLGQRDRLERGNWRTEWHPETDKTGNRCSWVMLFWPMFSKGWKTGRHSFLREPGSLLSRAGEAVQLVIPDTSNWKLPRRRGWGGAGGVDKPYLHFSLGDCWWSRKLCLIAGEQTVLSFPAAFQSTAAPSLPLMRKENISWTNRGFKFLQH